MLLAVGRAWSSALAAMLSLPACKEPAPRTASAGAKVVEEAATGSDTDAAPAEAESVEVQTDPRKPPPGVKRPRVEGEDDCRRAPDACVRRAVALTRTDLARAAALFGVACEENSAPACGNLAVLLRDGRGLAQDRRRAERLMRVACDEGHAPSCENARAFAWGQ